MKKKLLLFLTIFVVMMMGCTEEPLTTEGIEFVPDADYLYEGAKEFQEFYKINHRFPTEAEEYNIIKDVSAKYPLPSGWSMYFVILTNSQALLVVNETNKLEYSEQTLPEFQNVADFSGPRKDIREVVLLNVVSSSTLELEGSRLQMGR